MTKCLLILLLMLSSPVATTVAQETKSPEATAPQEWKAPQTLAEATQMLAQVTQEIADNEGEEAKVIRELLIKQKDQLTAIIARFKAIAAIPGLKSRLTEDIKTNTELLAKEEKLTAVDYSQREVDNKKLVEAKQEFENLNAAINKNQSELLASRTKKSELLNRLEKSLGETQKAQLALVTAAKIAVEKAKTEAPGDVSRLLKKQQLEELKLELITIGYDYDLELKKNQLADDEATLGKLRDQILQAQLKRYDEERQNISRRLAVLAQQASRANRTDIAEIKRRLDRLGENEGHKRPFIELELELAELKVEQNKFQKEQSDFTQLIDARGLFSALSPSANTLAATIKRAKENPEEDELPSSAAELRALRDDALARYNIAKKNLADLRLISPQILKKIGDVVRYQKSTPEKLSLAREALRSGGGDPDATYWKELSAELSSEAAAQVSKVEGFSNKIKADIKSWDSLRGTANRNARFLSEKLLWTREESNMSVASVEMALEDLSETSGDLVNVIQKAGQRSLDQFTGKENRTRSLLALAFVILAGFGFWRLSRKLPKTYGWLDAQAAKGKNLTNVLAIILRRTDVSLMLAVVFVGAPWIAGLESSTVKFTACVFGVPFLYRLGRVLLDVFVGPGKDEERIFNLPDKIAETLHRAGRWLLNLAVFFVPVALITELSGYAEENPGFLEVWWLVYESLSHGILLFSVFRPAIVSSVIRGSGIVATSVKSWIFILYPLVVGGILFLFVLGSLRYLEAEQFFQTLFLKILGALFFGYLAYRFAIGRILKGRNLSKDPNPEEFEEDGLFVAAGRALFIDRLTRTCIRLAFLIPVGFLVFKFASDLELPFVHWPLFGGESITLKDILKAIISVIITSMIVRVIRQSLTFVILPRTDLDKGLRYTVSMLVTYSLWTIGAVVTLNILRVRGEHIAVFTGALAFGIGFGLQSIVKNFVSGLILLIERPVKVGDKIDVGSQGGSVEKITLRATTVMTFDGTGIVIPNETMVGGTLTNHSLGQPRLRSALAVGVAYGSDVKRVREILTETVRGHGLTLNRPGPESFFMGFGDSSLNFEVRYWTSLDTHRLRVISDLRFALDEAFRREDIEIPFPQRDLNVRTVDGTVVASFGGKTLEPESGDDGATEQESTSGKA